MYKRDELIRACEALAPDIDWAKVFAHPYHYLAMSVENPRQVAYCAKPEIAPDDDSRRTRTTLGRYLLRNFDIDLDSRTVENIISAISGKYDDDDFTILRGDEIVRAYENEVGGDSCMVGANAIYTSFYAQFPTKVALLVYKDDVGRALLWETDSGRQILDRIYCTDDTALDAYAAYCEDNNILPREHANGETISLGPAALECEYYPYLDTFCYINDRGTLNTRTGFKLRSTDGSGPNTITCNNCDSRLTRYDCHCIDGYEYCDSCFADANYCERCTEYTFTSGGTVDGEWCCNSCLEDANHCEYCDEHTFEDGENVDGEFCCNSCFKDANHCGYCGEHTFEDTETICGKECCESCLKDTTHCPECFQPAIGQHVCLDFCSTVVFDPTAISSALGSTLG